MGEIAPRLDQQGGWQGRALSPWAVIGVPACTAPPFIRLKPFILVKISSPKARMIFFLKNRGGALGCGSDIAAEGREQLAPGARFVGRQIGHHWLAMFEIGGQNG